MYQGHVRRVVARLCAVNGRIARPLLLAGGLALVDCTRQPYCQLSHLAVAVNHHCPHKAKAVLCPLVPTQTREKFLCPMPIFSQPLQKGGNHYERLDGANKMQVSAIPEWLTPKLDEINDVSSFGDVFQCYRWRQLYVINPPYEFFQCLTQNNGIAGSMDQRGRQLKVVGAARPIAPIHLRMSNTSSTSCLS